MENYGFLLLCSHLGNPDRKPLTTAQLRLPDGLWTAAPFQRVS